jgi:hypothetical protein
VTTTLESNKLKATTSPAIVGGKPGTTTGALGLENVTVAAPAKCEISGARSSANPLSANL